MPSSSARWAGVSQAGTGAGENLAGVVSFHGGLSTPAPAKPGEVKAKEIVAKLNHDDLQAFIATPKRV